jgi:hypothetical protein
MTGYNDIYRKGSLAMPANNPVNITPSYKKLLIGMYFAEDIVEATMEKNKLKNLLLLDLCAFAASLLAPGEREDILEDYRLAYSLAKSQHLAICKDYKDLLESL